MSTNQTATLSYNPLQTDPTRLLEPSEIKLTELASDHEESSEHDSIQQNEPSQPTKQENENKKKKKHKKKKRSSVPIDPTPSISLQQPKTHPNQVFTRVSSHHPPQPTTSQPIPQLAPHQNQKPQQPTVIRHKVYQIKRDLFSENAFGNSLGRQNTNVKNGLEAIKGDQLKENTIEKDVGDKEMRAITSVFGQFFRLENLKGYQKKEQTVGLQATQQVAINQPQNNTPSNLPTPTQDSTTPPTRRIIKTIKPLTTLPQQPTPLSQVQQTIYPTTPTPNHPNSQPTTPQLYTRIADYARFSNSKQASEASFKGYNNCDNLDSHLNIEILNGKECSSVEQVSSSCSGSEMEGKYEEPEFCMMMPVTGDGQSQEVTRQRQQQKVTFLVDKKQITEAPLMGMTNKSSSKDSRQKADQQEQKPISPQTFQHNFKYPEQQCESQGSFIKGEDTRQILRSNNKNANQSSKKTYQKINTNNGVTSTRPMNKLLLYSSEKDNYCESHYEADSEVAITPFFQRKDKDSDLYLEGNQKKHGGIDGNKDVGIDYVDEELAMQTNKRLNKTQSASFNIQTHPKPTLLPLSVQASQISHTQYSPRQQPSYIVNQKIDFVQVPPVPPAYPKRLTTFLPIEQQMSHIHKIFIDFNKENTLMIDSLSYNAGFQTLEEVSSNLVNEIDKQKEDRYVEGIVGGMGVEWREKLVRLNKSNEGTSQRDHLGGAIRQPMPTQTCSPSKYGNVGQISTGRNDLLTIKNKSPLRLPTFSQNSIIPSDEQQLVFEHEQRENLRDFYDYLQSRESAYKGQDESSDAIEAQSEEQPNSNPLPTQTPHHPHSHRKTSSQHSLHQLQQKPKPCILQQTRTINLFMPPSSQTTTITTSQQNLQTLAITYRTNNYLGGHVNLQNEAISEHGSLENSGLGENGKWWLGGQRKEVLVDNSLIVHERETVEIGGTNGEEWRTEQRTRSKLPQNFAFPIHAIEPISVTAKSKSKSKGKDTSSRLENSEKPVKKLRVISASSTLNHQRKLAPQIQRILQPPQMNTFLMNTSHLGSFMLNNAIQNFIVAQPKNEKENSTKKMGEQRESGKEATNSNIERQPQEQQITPSSTTKKKVPIKKNPQQNESSTKKLSINQKNLTTSTNLLTNPTFTPSTIPSTFHKLHPQMQQTITHITQKPQKQLHQLIRSRITERSNSRSLSSRYNSPVCNKLRNETGGNCSTSRLEENSMLLSNYVGQTEGKSMRLYRESRRQKERSVSNKKKAGLELWNQGLSDLKKSRKEELRSTRSPQIFKQQPRRQNEKIIGITKWNENLSKFKQSRSKSKDSRRSSLAKGHSQSKENKFYANNLTAEKNNDSASKQQQQPSLNTMMMNVEIKRHKYQVNNVQKRYL